MCNKPAWSALFPLVLLFFISYNLWLIYLKYEVISEVTTVATKFNYILSKLEHSCAAKVLPFLHCFIHPLLVFHLLFSFDYDFCSNLAYILKLKLLIFLLTYCQIKSMISLLSIFWTPLYTNDRSLLVTITLLRLRCTMTDFYNLYSRLVNSQRMHYL